MNMRSITVKSICVLLTLSFVTSQICAQEISSARYDNKLAASLVSDPDLKPDRSGAVRNDIAGAAEPGAIGNGAPLMELAQGKLPSRVTLQYQQFVMTASKLREAISVVMRLSIANERNFPAGHRERFRKAMDNLVDFSNRLEKRAYLYNADIRTPEDYLLGFNFGENVGLSLELIDRLYSISSTRLAQYIFHECVSEKDLIVREDHRAIYNEIQSVIFGKDEVESLKKDLRQFINEKLLPAAAAPKLSATQIDRAIGLAIEHIREYRKNIGGPGDREYNYVVDGLRGYFTNRNDSCISLIFLGLYHSTPPQADYHFNPATHLDFTTKNIVAATWATAYYELDIAQFKAIEAFLRTGEITEKVSSAFEKDRRMNEILQAAKIYRDEIRKEGGATFVAEPLAMAVPEESAATNMPAIALSPLKTHFEILKETLVKEFGWSVSGNHLYSPNHNVDGLEIFINKSEQLEFSGKRELNTIFDEKGATLTTAITFGASESRIKPNGAKRGTTLYYEDFIFHGPNPYVTLGVANEDIQSGRISYPRGTIFIIARPLFIEANKRKRGTDRKYLEEFGYAPAGLEHSPVRILTGSPLIEKLRLFSNPSEHTEEWNKAAQAYFINNYSFEVNYPRSFWQRIYTKNRPITLYIKGIDRGFYVHNSADLARILRLYGFDAVPESEYYINLNYNGSVHRVHFADIATIISIITMSELKNTPAPAADYYTKLRPADRAYIDKLSERYAGTTVAKNALAGARLGFVTAAELAKILNIDIGLAGAMVLQAQEPCAMAALEQPSDVTIASLPSNGFRPFVKYSSYLVNYHPNILNEDCFEFDKIVRALNIKEIDIVAFKAWFDFLMDKMRRHYRDRDLKPEPFYLMSRGFVWELSVQMIKDYKETLTLTEPIQQPFQEPAVLVSQISEDLPSRAQVFKANLTRILAEHSDQFFFMGIENDIGESQKAQIMPLYKAIDEIKELKDASGKPLFPNLMVTRGKAEELVKMAADLAKDGKLNLNNAFIGARKFSVDNKLYDSIKGEGKAWISAIDDSRSGDYLPVFEAITLNMMAYLNADLTAIKNFYDAISDKPIDPGVLQDMIRNRIIYILPKATAFDTKQLRELYELAHQFYVAA